MPPNRTAAYERAPLDELLTILLRQFKRPLQHHNVTISDADATAIATALARGEPLSEQGQAVHDALAALVTESEGVLAQWNLTFAQSIQTEMGDIPGWETTAEFLDVANEKTNAELRISTGAALLVAMGSVGYAHLLVPLAERTGSEADLDEVIARRVLLRASGIHPEDPAWLDRLRAWVNEQT